MKKTAALLLALGFVFAAGAADEAKETVLLDKKFGTDYRWGKVVYIHGAKGLKDPEEIKALAAVSYDDKGAVLETDEKLNTMKDGSGRKIYLSNNLTRSVNLPENAGEKNFIMSFDIEGKGNVELIAVVRGKKVTRLSCRKHFPCGFRRAIGFTHSRRNFRAVRRRSSVSAGCVRRAGSSSSPSGFRFCNRFR